MTYRRLGNSGIKVSVLSYGAWVTFSYQIGVEKAYEIMKEAYSHGVNFFDNAEAYASGEAETIMGQAVQKGIDEKVWKRSDLVLSTKIFFGDGGKGPNDRGLSRKHIMEGTKAALSRFGLDYVDLIFCHRPDPDTPIEETVRAMNHVLDRGWALYWGTSEWSMSEITQACQIADRLNLQKPLFEQPQYNLFSRTRVETEYSPLYEMHGLGLTTWSPLASGVLTGKYSGKKVEEGTRLAVENYSWLKDMVMNDRAWQIEKVDELKPIADELGCTRAQLAIAWCLKNKHVTTVILGATSVDQLKENVKALEVVDKLTDDVMKRIVAICTP
jgi:voltage-dependent potassium channel beta subunit